MSYPAALFAHPGSRWRPEMAMFGDDAPAQLRPQADSVRYTT
jgi:hypothetical protein